MRRSPPTTLPPLVCQRPVPCPLSPLLFLPPSPPSSSPPQHNNGRADYNSHVPARGFSFSRENFLVKFSLFIDLWRENHTALTN